MRKMAKIRVKDADSAAERPDFPLLNSNPVLATIFMTSFQTLLRAQRERREQDHRSICTE
jgi:hypothetical protein